MSNTEERFEDRLKKIIRFEQAFCGCSLYSATKWIGKIGLACGILMCGLACYLNFASRGNTLYEGNYGIYLSLYYISWAQFLIAIGPFEIWINRKLLNGVKEQNAKDVYEWWAFHGGLCTIILIGTLLCFNPYRMLGPYVMFFHLSILLPIYPILVVYKYYKLMESGKGQPVVENQDPMLPV